jgi:hypothetical protein
LHVTVHRVEQLTAAISKTLDDGRQHHKILGSADPYVKVGLAGHERQTPIVSDTLNPVWSTGNSFELTVYDTTSSLFCHVCDDDTTSESGAPSSGQNSPRPKQLGVANCLGQVAVPIARFMRDSASDAIGHQEGFDLTKCIDPSDALVCERTENGHDGATGARLWLTCIFIPSKLKRRRPVGWLEVTILRCDDLLAMDRDGFSDPFVEVMLDQEGHIPADSASTPCLRKTLNPVWTEANVLCLEIRTFEASLVCHVGDRDRLFGKTVNEDFIGEAQLELAQWIHAATETERASGKITVELGITTCNRSMYQSMSQLLTTIHGSVGQEIRPIAARASTNQSKKERISVRPNLQLTM